MKIFDTHAHYDDEAFNKDRAELIDSMHEDGILGICNAGARLEGSRDSVALSKSYDYIYAAVGVHPDDTEELSDEGIEELRAMAGEKKTVAIGEIGLDYHGFDIYEHKPDKETQKYWFNRQMELAGEVGLPIVIHSRTAGEDTLNLVRAMVKKGVRPGIVHCYSYSVEMAKTYLDMGFYIGVGGVLTYPGQKKLSRVVESSPIERIVLETDAPYLAPYPVRESDERNVSTNLSIVRDKIALLKGISKDEVEEITYENALRVYNIG